jgi:hypothetical protein
MQSQNTRILALLRQAGEQGITPLDGLQVAGSFRLAARIYDLRKQGYRIKASTFRTESGADVARYVLDEGPDCDYCDDGIRREFGWHVLMSGPGGVEGTWRVSCPKMVKPRAGVRPPMPEDYPDGPEGLAQFNADVDSYR